MTSALAGHRGTRLLVTVVAGPVSALGRALKRSRVENNGAGLFLSPFRPAQEGAQIVRDLLEYARSKPALRLLVDCGPGRQIVRHHAPGGAGPDDVAQSAHHLPQRVLSLRRFFSDQKVGRSECLLLVRDIIRVRLAPEFILLHASGLPAPPTPVHNTPSCR